jgi:hypothetical protein
MSTRPIPLGDSLSLLELYVYLVLCFFITALVLIQFGDTQRAIAFWLSFFLFSTILVVDVSAFAVHQQLKDFYLPFVTTLLVVCVFWILDLFTIPQRYC